MKGVKIGYAILLLATLLLAVVHDAYHIFLLLAAELLVPVFLLLYLSYCKHCLRVRLPVRRHSCNKGEKVPLALELANGGIFPAVNVRVAIRCSNRYLARDDEAVVVAAVGAGKTETVDFFLTSGHYGQLRVELGAVTILDPLSLFQARVEPGRKGDTEMSILVLPGLDPERAWPDYSLRAADDREDVYSSHQSGDDPAEVFAVREYRPGDRQRQIHWKLSFKQGQLMVREFSLPIRSRVTILMDFNVRSLAEDVLSLTDAMLETALSLSHYLQSNYIRHRIAWFDVRRQNTDSVDVDTEDDIYRALLHLFAVPLYEGESRGRKLYQAGPGEKSRQQVLFFAPGVAPNAPMVKGA